ncbi:MAG: DUF4432 family protein [Candidatus Sulfotelmatobacter sp.]
MPNCKAISVQWKNRHAYRLSNGAVELTMLLGGGHLADFRLSGSPINALWEAPWQTIEPQTFVSQEHASRYGDGAVGKMLCGYTGHALALGYFGMPSEAEAACGLPLHGEAVASEWKVLVASGDDDSARLVLEVALPFYKLHLRREILLKAESRTACITELVTNRGDTPVELQWVEHATFGEPLLAKGEASLFVSGSRGMTWPLGYEGHELLANSTEFRWPYAPSADGRQIDISQPFIRDGSGFIASVLTKRDRENAFVAVHNRRHALVAGYSFDPALFPWIALWEENCAREYPPWYGKVRARGVEFGTSPMPLGLDQARATRSLFDTPVLISIALNASVQTQYQIYVSRVPPEWTQIHDIRRSGDTLVIRGIEGEVRLDRGY